MLSQAHSALSQAVSVLSNATSNALSVANAASNAASVADAHANTASAAATSVDGRVNSVNTALSALSDEPAKAAEQPAETAVIAMTCSHCDHKWTEPASKAGKNVLCANPECRQRLKVPEPKGNKQVDWRQQGSQLPSLAKQAHEKLEAHTLRYQVPVPQEGAAKVTYRVRVRF